MVAGVHLNGQLSSGENLADIGGIILGCRALHTHLQANPQANRRQTAGPPSMPVFEKP